MQDNLLSDEMSEECRAEVTKDEVRREERDPGWPVNGLIEGWVGGLRRCCRRCGRDCSPPRPHQPTPQRAAAADFRLNWRLHQACGDDAQALCAGTPPTCVLLLAPATGCRPACWPPLLSCRHHRTSLPLPPPSRAQGVRGCKLRGSRAL